MAFASEDMSEWTVTSSIEYNGSAVAKNEDTQESSVTIKLFSDYIRYQVNYSKSISDTNYAAGELVLTIPSPFDEMACDEVTDSVSKFSMADDMWGPANGTNAFNKDTNSFEITNLNEIKGTEHVSGYIQITAEATYIDTTKSAESTAILSCSDKSVRSNNKILVDADIKKATYFSNKRTSLTYKYYYGDSDSNNYACYDSDLYTSSGNLRAGQNFWVTTDNENVVIYNRSDVVQAKSMENIEPIVQDGKYFIGSDSDYIFFKIPSGLTEKTVITFNIYTKYRTCNKYKLSYKRQDVEDDYSLIQTVSCTVDPDEYLNTEGNIGFDLLKRGLKYTTSSSVSNPSTYRSFDSSNKEWQFNASLAQTTSQVELSSSMQIDVNKDLSDCTVILCFNGVAKDKDTERELLSDDDYHIEGIYPYIADINGTVYSDTYYFKNANINAKLYVRHKHQNEYVLYDTLNSTSPKTFNSDDIVSYKLELSGDLFNGLGSSANSWAAYNCCATTINLESADIDSDSNIYLIGSMDILKDGVSIIDYDSTYDFMKCPELEHSTGIYSYIPYYALDVQYQPRVYFSQYDSESVTYNEAEKCVDGNFHITLDGSSCPHVKCNYALTAPAGVDINSDDLTCFDDAVISNIEIVKSKDATVINFTYTKTNQNSVLSNDEICVSYKVTKDYLTEFGSSQSFTVKATDFELEKFNYDNDSATDTETYTCLFPSSAQEAVTNFVAGNANYVTGTTKISESGTYTYKLMLCTTEKVSNTIIYCDIENSFGDNIYWQGSLNSIDTSSAAIKGYTLKPYYSENTCSVYSTDENDKQTVSVTELNNNTINNETWKEVTEDTDYSKIKALAFKVLNSDGEYAVLNASTSLYVLLNMEAPDSRNIEADTYAYNQFNVIWTPVGSDPVSLISNKVQVSLSHYGSSIDISELPETGSVSLICLTSAILILSVTYFWVRKKTEPALKPAEMQK